MMVRLPPILEAQRAQLGIDLPAVRPWASKIGHTPILGFLLHQQPTPQNRQYWVRYLASEQGAAVCVIDPRPIKDYEGRPTPHLNADGSLCLYDKKTGEWSIRRPLAQLVQFSNRWLFHYEHWEAYGEWLGDHAGESWEAQLAAIKVEVAELGRRSFR